MVSELLSRMMSSCVGGVVTIIGVFSLLRLLSRLPAKVLFWVWWLVCLKLVLGILVVSSLSLRVLPAPNQTRNTPVEVPSRTSRKVSPEAVTEPQPPASSTYTTVTSATSVTHSCLSSAQALMVLWLVGIGVGIGIQAMAFMQLNRVQKGATRGESQLITEAALLAGLRRTPSLWVANTPVEPLTAGLFRPHILVGRDDYARLSDSELLAILVHECMHIKRGDLILSLVPWLAQTLFWFFPPVYLAVQEFELAREAACDQQSVAVLPQSPRAYGELLVKLSSSVSSIPVPSSAMTLSAGFTTLKRRIEMLQIKPCGRSFIALTALVAVGLLVPWRLTAAPSTSRRVIDLPNLDFSHGMQGWQKTAMGSDTVTHPFYEVGVDKSMVHDGNPSGFVKARSNVDFSKQRQGGGGVLRYDVENAEDIARFAGRRVRWSGYVKGKNLTDHGYAFVGAYGKENGHYLGSTLASVSSKERGWQKRECVFDVPKGAKGVFVGFRLEGKGIIYASGFSLTTMDNYPQREVTRHIYPSSPRSDTIIVDRSRSRSSQVLGMTP